MSVKIVTMQISTNQGLGTNDSECFFQNGATLIKTVLTPDVMPPTLKNMYIMKHTNIKYQ